MMLANLYFCFLGIVVAFIVLAQTNRYFLEQRKHRELMSISDAQTWNNGKMLF